MFSSYHKNKTPQCLHGAVVVSRTSPELDSALPPFCVGCSFRVFREGRTRPINGDVRSAVRSGVRIKFTFGSRDPLNPRIYPVYPPRTPSGFIWTGARARVSRR